MGHQRFFSQNGCCGFLARLCGTCDEETKIRRMYQRTCSERSVDSNVDPASPDRSVRHFRLEGPMARLPTLHCVGWNTWSIVGWTVEVQKQFEIMNVDLRSDWQHTQLVRLPPERLVQFISEHFRWLGPQIHKTRYGHPRPSPALEAYIYQVHFCVTRIELGISGIESMMTLEGCFQPSFPLAYSLSYFVFVELNIHRSLPAVFPQDKGNPGKGLITRNNIYMFGETFHCGALLLLYREIGLNIVFGTNNCDFAHDQMSFLKSLVNADRISCSTSCLESGAVKLRLDQTSSLIADCYRPCPEVCASTVRRQMAAPAYDLLKGLGKSSDDIMASLFAVDLAVLARPVVMIMNRHSCTGNYACMDLLPSYLEFLLQVCQQLGVKTIIFGGDPLADLWSVVEPYRRHFGILDATDIYKNTLFRGVFNNGDGHFLRFSGQAWAMDALRPFVSVVIGPHSGGTDRFGLLGIPCIMYSPSDHPSHPRIPRIANTCDWFKIIAVGTIRYLEENQEFCPAGKDAFRDACMRLMHGSST